MNPIFGGIEQLNLRIQKFDKGVVYCVTWRNSMGTRIICNGQVVGWLKTCLINSGQLFIINGIGAINCRELINFSGQPNQWCSIFVELRFSIRCYSELIWERAFQQLHGRAIILYFREYICWPILISVHLFNIRTGAFIKLNSIKMLSPG